MFVGFVTNIRYETFPTCSLKCVKRLWHNSFESSVSSILEASMVSLQIKRLASNCTLLLTYMRSPAGLGQPAHVEFEVRVTTL